MEISGIGQGRIAALREQIRQAAESMQPSGMNSLVNHASSGRANTENLSSRISPSFAESLKASLDKVNEIQVSADSLSQRFSLGDDQVQLSNVMIERQKASLSLQATVQMRNRLVSAYHEIMNMSI